MRLEVDQVALLPRLEKMVEADLEQIGSRGVTGDVAAQFARHAVGALDHGEGVPANDRRDALFDFEVARELRLLVERDGVLVGGVENRRQAHALFARVVEQAAQYKGGAVAPLGCYQCVEGIQPFACLSVVGVLGQHAPERIKVGMEIRNIGHGLPARMQKWIVQS